MPSYIDWKIQSEVDRAEVEDALLGIKLMYQFGKQLGMPDPEERIVVYIDNDLERLASYYSELTGWDLELSRKSWEGGGAEAGQGWIMAMVSPPGETFWEPGGLVEPMAHELVHASFQTGVAGLLTDPAAFQGHGSVSSPRWLTEGMASLLSGLALAEHRGTDHSQKRKGWVLQAEAIDLPLRDAETWPSGWAGSVGPDDELDEGRVVINCIYKCGYVAVELLASRVGLRKLSDYYMYLEPRMLPRRVSEKDYPRPGWRVAFERAFEMPVEEFYVLFEEHRAAGFPDPNRPTPTGPQAVDDYIVWKVGDEVSPTAEAETRETVLAVHDYAVGIGMPRIDRPITIFLYHNLEALEAAFEAATGHEFQDGVGPDFAAGADPIMASRDFIALNTSAGGYRQQSPDQRKEELISLLFDVYRRALTGIWQYSPRDAVPPEGPVWLLSGASSFLTHQVLRAPGLESCDPTRGSYALRIARSGGAPLSELETRAGSASVQSSGAYGFLALEVLAEQSGPESIIGYFASLQPGVAWQEEFRTNFGMTVEEFYQLFEELRAAGFPDWDCSSARQPSTPTGLPLVAMPGVPHYLRWYIGPNVPQVYVEEMKKGARLVHEYATSWGLREFQRQIRIYFVGDLDTLTVIFSELVGGAAGPLPEPWKTSMAHASSIGVGDDSWIIMNAFHPQYASTDPKYRTKIAAHELFHGYQNTLSSFAPGTTEDSVPYNGPRWLAEGTAEFFSYKALDAEGTLTYEEERMASGRGFVARARGVEPPLSQMETQEGISRVGNAYPYSLLAAELLASHAGEAALLRFYMLQHPGTTWQQAFQMAFGMTVDDFYQLFEEQRAAGFPVVTTSPSLTTAASPPSLGLVSYKSECATLGSPPINYDCWLFLVAGSGPPDVGDSGPATKANLNRPLSVAVGPNGILIADSSNHRIRRVSSIGVIETVAGTGASEYRRVVDGDKATQATVRFPSGIAAADDGAIYIADSLNYVVRKISPEGMISTILGRPFTYDVAPEIEGTRATEATTGFLRAVEPDGFGGVYVAIQTSNQVVRVDSQGIIHVFAGTGSPGTAGEGGPAHMAELNSPDSLALDRAGGVLYINDSGNSRVVTVSLDTGVLLTIPGINKRASSIALDKRGQLYFSSGSQVWQWDPRSTSTTLIAGTSQSGRIGEGGPATAATIGYIEDIAVDPEGSIYIADSLNNLVWRVFPDGIINVFAGGTDVVLGDVAVADTYIWDGQGITIDSQGNVLITDFRNSALRQIGSDGIVRLIAGAARRKGSDGDGGHPTDAAISAPRAPLFDQYGNLYFLDRPNVHFVRRIEPGADGLVNGSPDERISTVVGRRGDWRKTDRGAADGGPPTNAVIQGLYGLVIESNGTMYIADINDNRIRKISPGNDGVVDGSPDEIIVTIAGDGLAGSEGDGGPANMARVNRPTWLAIDDNDNIYIVENWSRIRRIERGTQTISTVAILHDVRSIAIGSREEIYFAGSRGVGVVDPSSGREFTLLRREEEGTVHPSHIAIAPDGSIYIADAGAFRILRLEMVPQG